MKAYEKPKDIPQTQVAMNANSLLLGTDETKFRRRLQLDSKEDQWFADLERDKLWQVKLLDALEVQIKQEDESDVDDDIAEPENFKWDIIDYNQDFIYL